MTDPLVSVRNLRKAYRVYSHPSKMVAEVFTGRSHHREFVALDNISFDVQPGTVVGLLGRNGAGKSTLLRIVARTLDASGGTVITRGRIAAILELGTGFHLDYTGRENIYFGGICLGLSRREMHERIDEIVAFSELEEFIDQPFRTYSTGMQARLTFSVATCVDPDILIVDEALAVGDARFQLKSFDRMREFKRRGKAILLVSHSIDQVAAFCDYAILLDHGRMLADGDPNRIGNIYHELLFGTPTEATGDTKVEPAATSSIVETRVLHASFNDAGGQSEDDIRRADQPAADSICAPGPVFVASTDASAPAEVSLLETTGDEELEGVAQAAPPARQHRYGTGAAETLVIEIKDSAGRRCSRLTSLDTYDLVWRIIANKTLPNLCFGILLRDGRGIELFGINNLYGSGLRVGRLEEGTELEVVIRFRANLAAGDYFLTASLAGEDGIKHDLRFDTLHIVVAPTPLLHANSLVNLEARFMPVHLRRPAPQDLVRGVVEA